MKYYSDKTKKVYETIEELEKDEVEFDSKKLEEEQLVTDIKTAEDDVERLKKEYASAVNQKYDVLDEAKKECEKIMTEAQQKCDNIIEDAIALCDEKVDSSYDALESARKKRDSLVKNLRGKSSNRSKIHNWDELIDWLIEVL